MWKLKFKEFYSRASFLLEKFDYLINDDFYFLYSFSLDFRVYCEVYMRMFKYTWLI